MFSLFSSVKYVKHSLDLIEPDHTMEIEIEDERTVLYKTKLLDDVKPNTNPKSKTKTRPNHNTNPNLN